MKIKSSTLIPFGIAAVVVFFATALHIFSRRLALSSQEGGATALVEEIEWLTYDARVRLGARFVDQTTISQNIATLFLDDECFRQVNLGEIFHTLAPAMEDADKDRLRFGWPWPRFIHGQIVRELSAQGASAVGFDVMFAEEDQYNDITVPDGTNSFPSDEFFARQLARAGNVYLATEGGVLPQPLLLTNAAGLASINSRPDRGVLRRVRVFTEVKEWHPLILSLVKPLDLDLDFADFTDLGKVRIPTGKTSEDFKPEPLILYLNSDGSLKLTADGQLDLSDDPDDNGPTGVMPYRDRKVWNLGIALAARHLGLDLGRPEIKPGAITLRGKDGISRTIPIDSHGYFYIDWSVSFADLKNEHTPVYFGQLPALLYFDAGRTRQGLEDLPNYYTNRIVVIGSTATGNNLSDFGATPLDERTPLVTKHVNIANSLLNGQFIQRASTPAEAAIIILFGIATTIVSWRGRVLTASLCVFGMSVIYIFFATSLYINDRIWVAMFSPVAGGLLLPHFFVLGYRVIFEQQEKRRVRGIFTRIVAPEVVQELLTAEKLSLGGARRKITVYFADVRGFTEFTDASQASAEEYIRRNNLDPKAAEAHYNVTAAETLKTVNLYLGTIADIIKQHKGTLDKYIGDCVMAFWGAPVPEPRHAVMCVRAAMDAQRAIYELNQKRFAENEARKAENVRRETAGEPPIPLHPLLTLGSGINTGYAVVGLMGSEAAIANYTVFGREVNLASRLEGVSGRGRIIISEATYQEVKRDDPDLAAKCTILPPTLVKGFRQPVPIFEVAWKLAAPPAPAEPALPAPAPAKPKHLLVEK